MEIKKFFQIIVKWKMVFLLAFGTVVLGTGLFTFISPEIYQSETKLIILPSTDVFLDYNDVRNAITSLDNDIVANTYAEVAESSIVEDAARDKLNLESFDSYSIQSNVEAQTSIIVITVEGPDPHEAYLLASTIADEAILYVEDYSQVYHLQEIDKAQVEDNPISPNILFNMTIGVFLGLGAGLIFSYLGEYLTEEDAN